MVQDKFKPRRITEALDEMDRERVKVTSVQLRSVAPMPLARPFHDATMGPFDNYHPAFLRIVTDDGHYGECEYPLSGRWALEHIFLRLLLSMPPMPYRNLYHRMFWAIRNEGFRGNVALALGHIDRIFADLFSRRKRLPLFRYLGGDTNRVDVYVSGGSIALQGSELLDEMLCWEAEGYRHLKMKFGGIDVPLHDTVRRVSAVRERLREGTELAIDANQCLSLAEAVELADELRHLNIAWLEEPVHSADLRSIQSLCEVSEIPISYGESERSEKVFWTLAEAGVAHLQPIAGHLSALRGWFEVAQLARERGLAFTSGGSSYFNAPVVAAAGQGAMLEYLRPIIGTLQPILKEYPQASDGEFILSESPGLGTSVDWPLLAKIGKIEASQVWKR